MSNTGKWTWETERKERWWGETYDTRELAIEAGMKQSENDGLESFVIGRCEDHCLPGIDVDGLLDTLEDDFSNDAGDFAYEWRENISRDDENLLEEMLSQVFWKWLKETNNQPTSYAIVDIEKINVDEEGRKCLIKSG